ncbi:7747_t:CDS:2, partial [Racocetra persica]
IEHITVEYYCASTSYLLPEAIEEIIQSQEMQLIHSVVSSKIMSENNTSDKKSKKRKSGSGTEASFLANKVGITDIPIKKVDKMDDLRVKLAQNRKEREEAKREMKRVLDSN